MNFEAFVQTREYKKDVSALQGLKMGPNSMAHDRDSAEGYVYCGQFVIEYLPTADEQWYMRWFDWAQNKTVDRSENRLSTLERVLYDWAMQWGEIA